MPKKYEQAGRLNYTGAVDDEYGRIFSISKYGLDGIRANFGKTSSFGPGYSPITLDEFCQYLINEAFFGERLCFVDGWLILTPAWWRALLDPARYPLAPMLRSGLIVLHTRNQKGGLGDLVRTMEAAGVGTYPYLREPPYHEEFPKLQAILDEYDDAERSHHYVPWPKQEEFDLNKSYQELMHEAMIKSAREVGLSSRITETEWDTIAASFEGHLQSNPGRTAWNRAIIENIDKSGLLEADVRQLAILGTTIYHESRWKAFRRSVPSENISLRTVPTLATRDNFAQPRGISDDILLKSEDDALYLTAKWNRIKDFSKLEDLADPSSSLGSLKTQFIAARRDAYSSLEKLELYHQAALRYAREIHKTFGVQITCSESKNPAITYGVEQGFMQFGGAGSAIVQVLTSFQNDPAIVAAGLAANIAVTFAVGTTYNMVSRHFRSMHNQESYEVAPEKVVAFRDYSHLLQKWTDQKNLAQSYGKDPITDVRFHRPDTEVS